MDAAKQEPDRGSVGKIDVQGMIKQASSRVEVDELIRQGKKRISLLSRDKMADLIHRAAQAIIEKHIAQGDIARASSDTIDQESAAEFGAIVKEYQIADRAKQDVAQSKKALVEELANLRQELEKQKSAERIVEATSAGWTEFAEELDRRVAQAFDRRTLIIGYTGSPEEQEDLAETEKTFKAIIAKIVAAESQRFEAWGGRSREVVMLQKRLEMLQDHVATMEAAFKTLSESKMGSAQEIRNALRKLGLENEDPNFENKKKMLKVVLEANKDQKAKAAELAKRGVTLSSPRAVSA